MHPRATCSSLTQIVTAVKFGCLACVETLGDATHASAAGAAEGPLGAAPRHNRYFNTSPLAPRRQHRVAQAEEEDDHRARDAIGNGGQALLNPTNGSSYWLPLCQLPS